MKRLQEIPRRSLGWIPQDRVSTEKEKSSQVDSLEEFEAATQDLLSLKQRLKYSRSCLAGVLGSSQRRELLAKEKNHLRVASLEESGAATWNLKYQKQRSKDCSSCLGRISDTI